MSIVIATRPPASIAASAGGLGRYERTRRPRASRVVLTARERGLSNHLTSPFAAWRRDVAIAWRKRLRTGDPEGRGGRVADGLRRDLARCAGRLSR